MLIAPRALVPGDTIAVVAPSGPLEPAAAFKGLGFLSERYRLAFDRGVFARTGYLAGEDERRREELDEALRSADVAAIVVMIGGYGTGRFAHLVDWAALRATPKWIVGFSDATTLHVEAARVGVMSLHGASISSLGRADERARRQWLTTLEDPLGSRRWSALRVLSPGRARGPLFGGNLTTLYACAAAGRLMVPEGAILFLEDVREPPYMIDRMLVTLARGGHFASIAGVVLGDFTSCDPQSDGVTVETVLQDAFARLRVPVVSGLPAGHGRKNEALVLGGASTLDATGAEATLTQSGEVARSR